MWRMPTLLGRRGGHGTSFVSLEIHTPRLTQVASSKEGGLAVPKPCNVTQLHGRTWFRQRCSLSPTPPTRPPTPRLLQTPATQLCASSHPAPTWAHNMQVPNQSLHATQCWVRPGVGKGQGNHHHMTGKQAVLVSIHPTISTCR